MRLYPDKRVSNRREILLSAIKIINMYFNSSAHTSTEVVPQDLDELGNKRVQRSNKEEIDKDTFTRQKDFLPVEQK